MGETESVRNRESRIESVGNLGRMCTLRLLTVKRSCMLGGVLEVLLSYAFAATHPTYPSQ